MTVGASEIEEYQRDGVVCLRGCFEPRWIDLLRNGLEEVVGAAGSLSYVETAPDGSATYVSDMFSWTSKPALREFIFESRCAEMAAALMQASHVNFFYDHAFLRLNGSTRRTEWHNDKGFWPISGEKLCTMWIPLQPTHPSTGSLEYVVGSHRWAEMYKDHFFHIHRRFDVNEADADTGFLRPTPKIEDARDQYSLRSFNLEVGDCLVHHPLVLHASAESEKRDPRWAYSTNWAGEDIRYAPRVDTQRLISDPGLDPGDPLDCELFPRLWERP